MGKSSPLNLQIRGELSVQNQLALVKLDAGMRRRLLNRAAKKLRTVFRRYISSQTDSTGQPFKKRKRPYLKPKQKKKMLSGLAKKIVVTRLQDYEAELGWSNKRTAMIASVHNSGNVNIGRKRDMSAIREKMHHSPATGYQAKELCRLGYKIRKEQGKGWRRASKDYILNTLSFNQAGLIIKLLRAKIKGEKQTGNTWDIPIPARRFMAIDQPTLLNELVTDLLTQLLNSPKHNAGQANGNS